MAIPDHVLLKPGRLTDDEVAVIRTHAVVGEKILRDSASDLMRVAADIAGCHHGRWDGRGYPRGIAGDAIPLSAPIVAGADAFDAMTSERPYRSARPVDEALACMAEARGRRFDPRCADAFLAIHARLRQAPGVATPARTVGQRSDAVALASRVA